MASTPLLQCLHSYQQQDYLSSLRHLSSHQPSSELSHLISQTLTSIINIQLCNYNEAALKL